jgi:hypothetical protein
MYLNVSLNLTDLVAAYKAGHSAFTRHEKNGKVYVNTTIWINPDADADWKQVSVQLNSAKDKDAQDLPIVRSIGGEKAKKLYPGNGRIGKKKEPEGVQPGSTDLDLGGGNAPATGGFVPPQQEGDLPF